MQWRRRRRVLVVVGAAPRPLLCREDRLTSTEDEDRAVETERRWQETPRIRALRSLIRRYHGNDRSASSDRLSPDDGSEDEEARDEDRGSRERQYKPRPRYHQHHQHHQNSPAANHEKRTFNEDEYTRITTPRQDVLFKKGYLGRRRTTVDATAAHTNGTNGTSGTNGSSGTNGLSNGSTNGDSTLVNGEGIDGDCGGCVDGMDMQDDQGQYYYPNAFVDPNGVYYLNGGGFEVYDPYTGTVTVVVGPGPMGPMGPPMGMPPMEWFNPRLPPPPHGPPHGPPPGTLPPGPPHGPPIPPDYCFMHGRKRYSVDSQNCSGPSSESAGSGTGSGPPSSPQECESGGPGTSPGPSPGPPLPPMPPMGHIPFPPPHYVYPYMFGAPLYSLDGVSVQGGPPYGPACDVNAGSKRRKKKRRRKRKRGGVTDEGSEESSSEDKELEEGAGPSSLSSQSAASSQASAQATPTDSDAFTEFVAKHSTLNGDASAWEPPILTPPQTPTDCQQHNGHTPSAADLSNGLPQEAVPDPLSSADCPAGAPISQEEAQSSPNISYNPEAETQLKKTSEETREDLVPQLPREKAAHAEPDITRTSKSECPKVIENCADKKAEAILVDEGTHVKNQVLSNGGLTNGLSNGVSSSNKDTSLPPVINVEEKTLKLSSNSALIETSKQNGEALPVTEITVKAATVEIKACPPEKSVEVSQVVEKPPKAGTARNRSKENATAKRLVKSESQSGRRKTSPSSGRSKGKKGGPKTDLKACNGVMADKPTSKENGQAKHDDADADQADLGLSLRPEAPLAWGGRAAAVEREPVEEARSSEDLFLKALVGKLSQAAPDIPTDSESQTKPAHAAFGTGAVQTPQLDTGTKAALAVASAVQMDAQPQSKEELDGVPSAKAIEPEVSVQPVLTTKSAQSSSPTSNTHKTRLTPTSASQRRPKKWRQNAKERAPTPGRELAGSTTSSSPASSPPSPLSSEDETVIYTAQPSVSTGHSPFSGLPTKPPPEPPERGDPGPTMNLVVTADQGAREPSPLRITEAVTAWLRDHESEDVLAHLPASSDSESEDDDDLKSNETGPKNEMGNPFLASLRSCSSSASSRLSGDGEKRVAGESSDCAWDTLCDPTLFVAKYYRLGDDPRDDPPIMAMELLDQDAAASIARWPDQQDSGVHSDASGDEQRPVPARSYGSKRAAQAAQAELLATKSAFLLNQLKGQGPFPCGGMCCALQ